MIEINGSRKLVPEFKTVMIEEVKSKPERLQELIRIDRLDNIFASFYSSNQTKIDLELANDNSYNNSLAKVYYFEYDSLTWRSEIRYSFFGFKGTDLKAVDIKLINDGFIYTKQYTAENRKYKFERHDIASWYTLPKDLISQSFKQLLEFATTKIGLSTQNPAFFYSCDSDRLDIQIKDFKKQLSLSLTYEYGAPTHDFDDYWEDK